jgi:hypothetical protein
MKAARISETSVDISNQEHGSTSQKTLNFNLDHIYDDLHDFNVNFFFDEMIDIFAEKTRKIDLQYGVRHNLL